jgi:alkaline phosphatase
MPRMRAISLAVLLSGAVATGAAAQTVYPLDRAEILQGARFDFKVEFPGAPSAANVKVTINGQDPAALLGTAATFVEKEDGGEYSAYWIRRAVITRPGTYTVEATADGKTARVAWEVFNTNGGGTKAKNVILFIGDGMSMAHRTAARVLSKGLVAGRYGGELAIDDMPHMALVSTSGTDSIVTDSANSASAYTTGHKSCVNAMGIYCARNQNNLQHPRVETISELVKRVRGMSVGVVTNTEIEDATPAAMVAHTRRRADYNDIVKMFFEVQPDVIMGGGSPNFWPKSAEGSKRNDEENFVKKFEEAGYAFVKTRTELLANKGNHGKLLGLFNTGNIDGALDRLFLKKGTVAKFPDQPDLTDQVRVALDMLSKNDKGFVLMVESGRIDKYSHSLDWERAVYDTIMLDNAVKVAKEFAASRNDTLIIVVADHAHAVSIVGTYDDEITGTARQRLGTYAESKFPNYPPADGAGYPDKVDVSRRLAFVFGSYPDFCDTGRPYLDGENVPAVPGTEKGTYVANEQYCVPGAIRRTGNLPFGLNQGVHSADDVVLTAMGPGAELFRGRIDNTRVFRVMTTALGLAPQASQ